MVRKRRKGPGRERFEKGHRVKMNWPYSGLPMGTVGTIVYVDVGSILPYFVNFWPWSGGHDGSAFKDAHPEADYELLDGPYGMWVAEKWVRPAPGKPGPARPPAPKPTAPPFLPGDRVRMIKPGSEVPVGTEGTYITRFQNTHVIAVDWAPWNHGHDMHSEFSGHFGYPIGTKLPGKTGWNVDMSAVKLIQRGNIVIEEE